MVSCIRWRLETDTIQKYVSTRKFMIPNGKTLSITIDVSQNTLHILELYNTYWISVHQETLNNINQCKKRARELLTSYGIEFASRR